MLFRSAFETILQVQSLKEKKWDETVANLIPSLPKLQNNRTKIVEKELIFSHNNIEKVLLVVLSYIESSKDVYEGFVVVLNDITTLRELEQKSARKERLSEMGDLAAGVAHEVRNPLNTISIASQRLAGEFIPVENKEEDRKSVV